jgi:hypothetical protein
MLVTYVRKGRQVEAGIFRDYCDYIFTVQGHHLEEVRVGITGGWHDVIASLGKALTDDELIAIAKEFLERELGKGWMPSPEMNSLKISSVVMEYRVHNDSFQI